MEFGILGPLEAREGEREIPLGGAKQRALLAVLLLHAGEAVSTDRLIDALWGERPPGTAANTLQVYVSQLRKALGSRESIATRPPGYAILLEAGQLDLDRFEGLLERGRRALAEGRAAAAAAALREALVLFRGPPLADLAYEEFAESAVARLEELRVATLEDRVEADLALGRHPDLVPELEQLVAEHPLRERFRGQLMLALYRCGRQAEALAAYQEARRALVEDLGIEPGPALQRLERSILNQDPVLELAPAPGAPGASAGDGPLRSILVVPREQGSLEGLLGLASLLARARGPRELIVTRLVSPAAAGSLAELTAELHAWRTALAAGRVPARVAAFTSSDPGSDLVRLASQPEVDLLVLGAPPGLETDGLVAGPLGTALADAPCDVAVLVERERQGLPRGDARPVLVPFGGSDNDWTALELAGWAAGGLSAPLRLAGPGGGAGAGGHDASWVLANASLVVQRYTGIATEPLLVEPGAEGVLHAAEEAALLVVGLSDRWRQEGLGEVRAALVGRARPPTLLVRRGLRPGGLAPQARLTRFTWSLSSSAGGPASGARGRGAARSRRA